MHKGRMVLISAWLVMAMLVQSGLARGQDLEPIVTFRADGAIVIRNQTSGPPVTGAPDSSSGIGGQASEPTTDQLPDGSIIIYGQIHYRQSLVGYVVQAQDPPGVHGEYLIANPNEKVLSALAQKGTPVTVQGFLTRGVFVLEVQTIDGKPYHS